MAMSMSSIIIVIIIVVVRGGFKTQPPVELRSIVLRTISDDSDFAFASYA